MTNLKCNADDCQHNQDHRCCLSDIRVMGPESVSRFDTCCASFVRRGSGAVSAVNEGYPKDLTDISCSAQRCVHHTGRDLCSADCVCVGANGEHSNRPEETRCETFAALS